MDSDAACPICDGVADRFGDHAHTCPCGGDRTKTHHRLRNLVAARAKAAGLSPELEKPGLLPPRPELAGCAGWCSLWGAGDWLTSGCPTEASTARPLFGHASGSAGSCGCGRLPLIMRPTSGATLTLKRSALLKAYSSCLWWQRPMEAGAAGVDCAGSSHLYRTGEALSLETDRLHQALALTLQRENAWAVLRRILAAEGNLETQVLPNP